MRFDEGKDAQTSKMGAVCSILLALTLIMYSGYKLSILEGRKSIDIVQAVKENHFDANSVFSAKQGLNIAVAVTDSVDTNDWGPIDPSYGSLVFGIHKHEFDAKE